MRKGRLPSCRGGLRAIRGCWLWAGCGKTPDAGEVPLLGGAVLTVFTQT
jgi:hypothetical protein